MPALDHEWKDGLGLGRILGISEHTAIRHVNRATHKLGAANKHQAVLTALRMRLIG
jgi:DNA-binding CsgD family transcriptional regulator